MVFSFLERTKFNPHWLPWKKKKNQLRIWSSLTYWTSSAHFEEITTTFGRKECVPLQRRGKSKHLRSSYGKIYWIVLKISPLSCIFSEPSPQWLFSIFKFEQIVRLKEIWLQWHYRLSNKRLFVDFDSYNYLEGIRKSGTLWTTCRFRKQYVEKLSVSLSKTCVSLKKLKQKYMKLFYD